MSNEAFEYKYDIDGAEPISIALPCVTSTSFDAGDIVEFSSGLIRKAVAGSTAIAGVAVEGVVSAAAGQKVQVLVSRGAIFRVKYTPGTKTSLTNADRGTAFDLDASNAKTINLDDTTGGMCVVIDFDNVAKTADVLLKSRTLAN